MTKRGLKRYINAWCRVEALRVKYDTLLRDDNDMFIEMDNLIEDMRISLNIGEEIAEIILEHLGYKEPEDIFRIIIEHYNIRE